MRSDPHGSGSSAVRSAAVSRDPALSEIEGNLLFCYAEADSSPKNWLGMTRVQNAFSKLRHHAEGAARESAAPTIRRGIRCTIQRFTEDEMPQYVIERELPGAGELTPEQLKGISQKSCSVLRNLGPEIEWRHSYVTSDKIYCVYDAPNEEMIREHARQGGFPANRVSEVKTTISPKTAEG
jgi:hypothetical protein